MNYENFDPGTFYDRKDETEIFNEMLKFSDDVRLLTVEGTGGSGKSTYLMRLRHECKRARIPACLIPLDQLQEKSPFSLVSAIREGLAKLEFRRFEELNAARSARVFAPFASFQSRIEGTVSTRDISGNSNTIIGQNYNPQYEAETINIHGLAQNWASSDQEDIAREQCIKAFFRDLKEDHGDRPLVVLLDAYEYKRIGDYLYHWIQDPFLDFLCFDVENRPKRLVIVLAARKLPDFSDLLLERYEQLVQPIKSFSTWEETDVKNFLYAHGYKTVSEWLVKMICDEMKKDKFTLTAALTMAQGYRDLTQGSIESD